MALAWHGARFRHLASLTQRSIAQCLNSPSCQITPPAASREFRTSARAFDKAAPKCSVDPSKIRDFAIIAHIDHGKTTLMDRLLAFCGQGTSEDRVMDSNTLEKERGITILSKYTSLSYKGYTINAVDTPGHADFGGEVERVLGMVDGTVLLVDATEGALAQTKFVLEKALKRGFKPIVVLNKVDREMSTPERTSQVESQLFDLFASLGANDEQLDFHDGRILYASAKQGWATTELPVGGKAPPGASMAPLMDAIIRIIPPPNAPVDQPFAMCVAMIEHDNFIGRIATGRVASGVARMGDPIRVLSYDSDGTSVREEGKITRIYKRYGINKILLEEAVAGDVVSIAGALSAGIADTIAAPSVGLAIDPGHIDPPTLSMLFFPNDSPLAGRAGKAATSRVIGDRLLAEAESSVSLRVLPVAGGIEKYEVQARGELQLGILIENMRREGMELAVSPPQVLIKNDDEGCRTEPMEDVMCEVADEVAGQIIESLSLRKGEMTDMMPMGGKQRINFTVPSRGLIGFKTVFVNITRGEGIMARSFQGYGPYKGPLEGVRKGVMVSTAEGKATTFALGSLQSRGTFFISPGADVYEGMVIGEHAKDDDLEVNPANKKKLTNMRSVNAEEKVSLSAVRQLSLEEAIGYVSGDELIEVTPAAIRIRKEELDCSKRRTQIRRAKHQ